MGKTFEWWEKTVEYAFLTTAVMEGKCTYAVPMAGKPERAAGDAIFGVPNSFVLIEFKREKEELSSEIPLFWDYEATKQILGHYKHHHFVYGEELPDAPGMLALYAQPYFSLSNRCSALDCLESGIGEADFRHYLELLFAAKKEDGRSSSGQISPEALSTVLGLSANGHIVQAVPMYIYAPDLFPADRYEPLGASSSPFFGGPG